jgi:hypothetical protein
MVRVNDRIALAVAYLLSSFAMRRSITQGESVRNLALSAPTTHLALSTLLLAAKVFLQRTASNLFRVNMLVKCLMADWQIACNLFRAPLQFTQVGCLLSHPGRHCGCVPAFLRALWSQFLRLALSGNLQGPDCEKAPG